MVMDESVFPMLNLRVLLTLIHVYRCSNLKHGEENEIV